MSFMSAPQITRILGIDPGYDRCGWAVIEVDNRQEAAVDYGCFTTSSKQTKLDRLRSIQKQMQAVISKFHPDYLAIESLFFSRNVSTALPVSEARGVMLAVAFENQLEVGEYRPNAIKLAVTGYGRAGKNQVTDMVVRLLKLEKTPKIDDTGDALAVALAAAAAKRSRLNI